MFGSVWVRLGPFRGSVWVRLGPFRYGSKLNAKWAELVQLFQKFMPRSRVRIYHNECNRSTPIGP